jgi:hypothetical protein
VHARSPRYSTAPGPPPGRAAKRVAYLGIGSLPGLLFCGLGAFLAAAALVLAPRVRREIAASGGALGGAELVRIAQICAVVSLVITVFVAVLAIAVAGVVLLR